MSVIQLLDQATINKIAAGEVVERPISIVKELVENAIDAKSEAITIEIEDGGLKMIRITDNGVGIEKDDVKNAFIRHATSKIKDANDLSSIASLGFRGEALASIAAVSMTECITKTAKDLTGMHYKIEGGIEKSHGEIGCPTGTTFIIKELFYNVPARKKFLKSAQTEANYITEFIQRIALSHVGISFKYIINGTVKLHTSGNYSLTDCIYHVFGKEFAKNCLPVDYKRGNYLIRGMVGQPILSRGNRQYEIYYVNGRYIKSNFIQKGIEEGMKEAMMIHQFPFAVLFLTLPFDAVDVNVHPNKMQVRFSEELYIQSLFKEAVLSAFQKKDHIPVASLSEDEDQKRTKEEKSVYAKAIKDAPEPFEVQRRASFVASTPMSTSTPSSAQTSPLASVETSASKSAQTSAPISAQMSAPTSMQTTVPNKTEVSSMSSTVINTSSINIPSINTPLINTPSIDAATPSLPKAETDSLSNSLESQHSKAVVFENEKSEAIKMDLFLDEQKVVKHKVIGQLFKTYWLVEFHEELYIIDQHAAHEKVLYETWVNAVQNMNIPSQMLIEPFVYTLSDAEYNVFLSIQEELSTLGFEVESFGGTSIVVKSVPYLLNEPMTDIDFIYFFDQIYAGEASLKKEEKYVHKLASIACKSAIKGNDRLSLIEYESLIQQLLRLDDPYHCPHGRPTMIRMSQYELERKFRRIV